MTTRIVLCVCLAAANASFAAVTGVQKAGIAGEWKASLVADHVVPVGLEITEEAKTVKATLMLPGGEVLLQGEAIDGTYVLKGVAEGPAGSHGMGGPMTLEVKLKDDGTLDGTLSTAHGKRPLTAERFDKRPAKKPGIR